MNTVNLNHYQLALIIKCLNYVICFCDCNPVMLRLWGESTVNDMKTLTAYLKENNFKP